MNIHDATEQAYKNGFEAGARKLAEKLKDEAVYFGRVVEVKKIDSIVEELTVNYGSSKNDKQRKENENEQRGF